MTNDSHKKIIEMFNIALIYRKISYELNQNKDISMIIPSQVNAALTLEIYLKIIYIHENNKYKFKKTHKLDVLFNELNCTTKNSIKFDFREILKNRDMSDVNILKNEMKKRNPLYSISINLEDLLKEWGRVFVEARYWYELEGKELNMVMFPEIDDVLRSYIEKNVLSPHSLTSCNSYMAC